MVLDKKGVIFCTTEEHIYQIIHNKGLKKNIRNGTGRPGGPMGPRGPEGPEIPCRKTHRY